MGNENIYPAELHEFMDEYIPDWRTMPLDKLDELIQSGELRRRVYETVDQMLDLMNKLPAEN